MFNITTLILKSQKEFVSITTNRLNQTNIIVLLEKSHVAKCVHYACITKKKKAFKFANIPNYDGYQRGLASIVYKFVDKKSSAGTVKNENISNRCC